MYIAGKATQVAREMDRYQLDVLGISETRWTGAGRVTLANGSTLLYAGEEEGHQKGVALMISQEAQRSLMEWMPVSSRVISARFYSRFKKITIIQAYAPTNDATPEEKDDFYHQLQTTTDRCNKNDIVIVMGDMNAKVGDDNSEMEEVIGRHGLGSRNDNGERLCEYCSINGLVITGTCFPHKDIHKATWVSPDGQTRNQIDHIMIRRTWRTSVTDTRVQRGADAASDHYLVVTKLQMKLHKDPNRKKIKARFDTQKLDSAMFKEKFNIELSNRFEALEVEEDVNDDCSQIEKVYTETADKVLGRVKKRSKQWLRDDTWRAIEERRQIGNKIDSTRSERVKGRLRIEYRLKDREVKRRAREDKRHWTEEIAKEAERSAEKGRTRELYQAARRLTNKKMRQAAAVKDKHGEVIKDKEVRLERWAEHFEEVLVRKAPSNPVTDEETAAEEMREMDTAEIREDEVRQALRKTKSGKAPGMDEIPAELLKASGDTAVQELTRLYRKIWKEERIPDNWKKGIIVKLPKKGDLSECKNWRGVTLLPVMSKIMGRIIIDRIQRGVDEALRKEQAGFRRNRSTVEQIFVLRNIMEQVNEWRATLYTHFIDFEKAFDSIHRESLWKIMKSYGIPEKLVKMVKIMYEDFECTVMDDGEQTRWIKITTGVKQGCVMSGFLFLIAIDWVMRKTTHGHKNGIRWNFTSVLEDLDFADDIALISSKYEHIQSKTDPLVENAGRVGLKLNAAKCKMMRSNARRQDRVKIGEDEVEEVEEFVYLGATVRKDGGGTEDIRNRLNKARRAFYNLTKIWRLRSIGRQTKIKLFKTLVRPVLLYGCEAWKMTKVEEKKMDAFQFVCLRRILGIRWPQRVSNERIGDITGINKTSDEIRRRRWNWIGHVLRKDATDNCRVALGWQPEGKRAVGRPKTTWRRTVENERKSEGWNSWREVKVIAEDRVGWKTRVAALCASWRGEI